MDYRQQLQQLFGFDLWCSRKIADHLTESGPFTEKAACKALLSHIINSQKIWFYRVVSLDDLQPGPWEEYAPEDLKKEAKSANQLWIDLIGDHELDLESIIHYQNSAGNHFKNSVIDICHHLVIHGQHHRAQISLLMRQGGVEPLPTDYIHYQRIGELLKKRSQS